MDHEPILARAIIEMMGAPKEYIEQTLKNYISQLKKDGLQVMTEVYEAAEQKGTFFSAFVEIEATFKDSEALLSFCFDSMPSSVEILAPTELRLPSGEFTDFLNDLQARLHEVDFLVKNSDVQKQLLDNNALNVLHNFIKYLLKDGPKSVDELSKHMGINQKELAPILDQFALKKAIKKENDTYTI